MLLMITMLTTVVFSLPTITEHGNKSEASRTETRKPVVILVEEKNPNSVSFILEIIYNANSIADSKVKNKDKYVVDSETKEINNKNINFTNNETINLSQTPNIKQESGTQARKPAANVKIQEGREQMMTSSLISEEVSPLLGKWPKYFHDIFQPIQPFPELHSENLNKIQENKIQSAIFDAHKSSYDREQKKSQETAGPQLNPVSIYDREFKQSTFD